MELRKFSVFEAIVFGLKTVFDNFRLFFLISATYLAVFILALLTMIMTIGMGILMTLKDTLPSMVQECKAGSCQPMVQKIWELFKLMPLPAILLIGFVTWIILYGLSLGYIRIALDLHDTSYSNFKRLFSCFPLIFKVFIAQLLFTIMVSLGLILFIIPGIYLMLRCGLYAYFIVDQHAGIIESLKQSYTATEGQTWHLASLYLALLVIVLVAKPVGFLIMTPVSILAYAYVYRKITGSLLVR